MSYYFGPCRQSVHLSTLEEVTLAAQGGLLAENQWCELKEGLGPAKRAINVELARDLASLSLDGGVLIYGIKDKTYEIVGCEAHSLETRVSQVAATNVQPPISPVFNPPIEVSEGKFVVVISVPPSAVAPHMADSRYWGRSSEGKRVLSDSEVRRIIQANAADEDRFKSTVAEFVEQDPLSALVEDGKPQNGHVFFIAQPLAQFRMSNLNSKALIELLGQIATTLPLSPLLDRCTHQAHDPNGVGLRNFYEPLPQSNEKSLTQVTIQDNCVVRSSFGGGSFRDSGPTSHDQKFTLPDTVLTFIAQNLELLALISSKYAYQGEWRVAIEMTHLRDAVRMTSDFSHRPVAYPYDRYQTLSVVQPLQWTTNIADPRNLTMRLLSGYLRGLGVANQDFDTVMNAV